jgi:small subunit ribosomal protein S8e
MAKWRLKTTRRKTGALVHKNGKKTRMQRSRKFVETKVAPVKTKTEDRRGGLVEKILLSSDKVNLLDKKTGKTVVAKIMLVSSNPANPHYTRRNILTRGAIIKTDAGSAKVTNRPARDGFVNAVLESK